MIVATVLRSGGIYGPQHVERLAKQCALLLTPPFEFICLSDTPDTAFSIPLSRPWPAWWSKLSLFDRAWSEPTLFLDLDTTITGQLNPLIDALSASPWAMLSDFYRPDRPQSGVMWWQPAMIPHLAAIPELFALDPERNAKRFWGDGEFIASLIERGEIKAPDRIQSLAPGMVQSYKVHLRDGAGLSDECRVLCYHGKPKPWDVEDA